MVKRKVDKEKIQKILENRGYKDGEPLGGIAARRAAISRGSAGNEF